MSKQYDGINQYSAVAACPVNAYPVMLACWFYVSSAQDAVLMGVYDATAPDGWLRIKITATQKVYASGRNGGAIANSDSINTYNLNAWNHALAYFDSPTFRIIYLNTVQGNIDFTDITFPALNAIALGRNHTSAPGLYLDGRIADAAIWNNSLPGLDQMVTALYSGLSSRLVDLPGLVAYWPLIHTTVAACRIAFGSDAYELADYNGPVNAEHPRIVYGVKPSVNLVAASAAKAVTQYWHNLSGRPDKDLLPVI